MPNNDTFSVPVIGDFVRQRLNQSKVSVDPFARNKRWATYTNDLNQNTEAEYHLQADEFLRHLQRENVKANLMILDPPYSPRQIAECYQDAGIKCGQTDTQNPALMARVRSAVIPLLVENATVLSFGWNSTGMGIGFRIEEIMLVCHGGAHNDTICMAERFVGQATSLFDLVIHTPPRV